MAFLSKGAQGMQVDLSVGEGSTASMRQQRSSFETDANEFKRSLGSRDTSGAYDYDKVHAAIQCLLLHGRNAESEAAIQKHFQSLIQNVILLFTRINPGGRRDPGSTQAVGDAIMIDVLNLFAMLARCNSTSLVPLWSSFLSDSLSVESAVIRLTSRLYGVDTESVWSDSITHIRDSTPNLKLRSPLVLLSLQSPDALKVHAVAGMRGMLTDLPLHKWFIMQLKAEENATKGPAMKTQNARARKGPGMSVMGPSSSSSSSSLMGNRIVTHLLKILRVTILGLSSLCAGHDTGLASEEGPKRTDRGVVLQEWLKLAYVFIEQISVIRKSRAWSMSVAQRKKRAGKGVSRTTGSHQDIAASGGSSAPSQSRHEEPLASTLQSLTLALLMVVCQLAVEECAHSVSVVLQPCQQTRGVVNGNVNELAHVTGGRKASPKPNPGAPKSNDKEKDTARAHSPSRPHCANPNVLTSSQVPAQALQWLAGVVEICGNWESFHTALKASFTYSPKSFKPSSAHIDPISGSQQRGQAAETTGSAIAGKSWRNVEASLDVWRRAATVQDVSCSNQTPTNAAVHAPEQSSTSSTSAVLETPTYTELPFLRLMCNMCGGSSAAQPHGTGVSMPSAPVMQHSRALIKALFDHTDVFVICSVDMVDEGGMTRNGSKIVEENCTNALKSLISDSASHPNAGNRLFAMNLLTALVQRAKKRLPTASVSCTQNGVPVEHTLLETYSLGPFTSTALAGMLLAGCVDTDHQVGAQSVIAIGQLPAGLWRVLSMQPPLLNTNMNNCSNNKNANVNKRTISATWVPASTEKTFHVIDETSGVVECAGEASLRSQLLGMILSHSSNSIGTVRIVAFRALGEAIASGAISPLTILPSTPPPNGGSDPGVHLRIKLAGTDSDKVVEEDIESALLRHICIGCVDSKLQVRLQACFALGNLLVKLLPYRNAAILSLHTSPSVTNIPTKTPAAPPTFSQRLEKLNNDLSSLDSATAPVPFLDAISAAIAHTQADSNAPVPFPWVVGKLWVSLCGLAMGLLRDSDKVLASTARCLGLLACGLDPGSQQQFVLLKSIISELMQHILLGKRSKQSIGDGLKSLDELTKQSLDKQPKKVMFALCQALCQVTSILCRGSAKCADGDMGFLSGCVTDVRNILAGLLRYGVVKVQSQACRGLLDIFLASEDILHDNADGSVGGSNVGTESDVHDDINPGEHIYEGVEARLAEYRKESFAKVFESVLLTAGTIAGQSSTTATAKAHSRGSGSVSTAIQGKQQGKPSDNLGGDGDDNDDDRAADREEAFHRNLLVLLHFMLTETMNARDRSKALDLWLYHGDLVCAFLQQIACDKDPIKDIRKAKNAPEGLDDDVGRGAAYSKQADNNATIIPTGKAVGQPSSCAVEAVSCQQLVMEIATTVLEWSERMPTGYHSATSGESDLSIASVTSYYDPFQTSARIFDVDALDRPWGTDTDVSSAAPSDAAHTALSYTGIGNQGDYVSYYSSVHAFDSFGNGAGGAGAGGRARGHSLSRESVQRLHDLLETSRNTSGVSARHVLHDTSDASMIGGADRYASADGAKFGALGYEPVFSHASNSAGTGAGGGEAKRTGGTGDGVSDWSPVARALQNPNTQVHENAHTQSYLSSHNTSLIQHTLGDDDDEDDEDEI